MKWLTFLLFSSLILSVPQLCKKEFKLPPIHASIPNNPAWDIPPPSEEILAILNQPYIYLSHGNQSTVFQSEDGQYVLKLFRYRRSLFPILHEFKNLFKKKRKENFLNKLNKTFSAAHIACTEAREFTQGIYCHLNLTENLLPSIQLEAERTYILPLDSYRFVVQRKVTPFKEKLLSAKDNPKEMSELIDSFIQLIVNRSAKNIRNSDPNLAPNFGFLGNQAVELDFGNYQLIEPNPKLRKAEITNLLCRFEKWLKRNAPEYVNELCLKREILYDPEE